MIAVGITIAMIAMCCAVVASCVRETNEVTSVRSVNTGKNNITK